MSENKQQRPFGLRDKIGYLFGDFGNNFTFVFSTTILMKFYTDVVGVSAGVVGTIMMLARFVDAFTDVTMGRICDRSRVTKQGKFKPWILRMCIPVALSSFLIYQSSVASLPLWGKIIYLAVTYILWGSVFYTAVNIPYGSMASLISGEPTHRQSLSAFRTMGGMFAGVIIGVGLPFFAYEKNHLGKEILLGNRVTFIAGLFSVLAVVCYFLCWYLVTERVTPENNKKSVKNASVKMMFVNAVKNRALVSIIAASVVMLLSQLTMQNMSGYIFPEFYNNATAQSVSNIFMLIGMIGAALFANPISRKIGKAEMSVIASIFAAVVCVCIYLIRPENVWVYVVLQTFFWFGLGIFSMVNWALITDVIDYSEIKNGVREDGSVYALYSFARKVGQAAASGISGWLLTAIGYSEERAKLGQSQTDSVLDGIFNISALVPALGLVLLALILWFWYPLHKKQVDENVEILRNKHNKGDIDNATDN